MNNADFFYISAIAILLIANLFIYRLARKKSKRDGFVAGAIWLLHSVHDMLKRKQVEEGYIRSFIDELGREIERQKDVLNKTF